MTRRDDIDALFREASAARRIEEAENGLDACDETTELDGIFLNASSRVRSGKVTFHALPDGDIHVCHGSACAYVCATSENSLVCQISGQVVGIHTAPESDASWTGRSCASANPDENSGGTPMGGWMKKRDAFAASVAAYQLASTLCDAVDDVAVPMAPRRRKAVEVHKRGALCVDEAGANEPVTKKSRMARKDGFSRETILKLENEAQTVLTKLMVCKPEERTPLATVSNKEMAPPPPKLDPRLQNVDFVRRLALRRYVRACVDGDEAYNLDAVQNVLIAVNKFVQGQRELADAQLEAAKRAACARTPPSANAGTVFTGKLKAQISALVVTLWRAACATVYLQREKKSNDSFRPFAAGVLYSFKRGVHLGNGQCLVPVLPNLVGYLPALRSNLSTASARQLQSSSHRGVCCLQRSLASLAEMTPEQREVPERLFEDASRQASHLKSLFVV